MLGRSGVGRRLGLGEALESLTDYLVPCILFFASAFALGRKENSYDILLHGAGEGLRLLLSIVPSLILLMTAVSMLRASGAMEAIQRVLSPVFRLFGIPEECTLLVLIRPVSGSAALAVGTEIMKTYGVDSLIGRTAAVMLGSTETTFYTISVYFGAAGIRKTRYTVPAALFADFIGFFAASWTTRLWMH